MKNVLADGRLTQRATTDHICTPRLAGRGEWGWSEGSPGQYLILTQSLHFKYTCVKRAVSNSSSLYTLFYSVIYNSVVQTHLVP